MTKDQARKLLKLGDFLYTLPRKLFNYNSVMAKGSKEPLDALKAGGGCGTKGCAMGWLPAIFPRTFAWRGDRWWPDSELDIFLKANPQLSTFRSVEIYFGLDADEAEFLFQPSYSNGDGETSPEGDASAKEVGRHIRRFVYARYPDLRPSRNRGKVSS